MQLRTYLSQTDTTTSAFAQRIGVSVQAVHRYISGERFPHRDILLRIQSATEGAVQPNDFLAPASQDAA